MLRLHTSRSEMLSMPSRFIGGMVNHVLSTTPVTMHRGVRARRIEARQLQRSGRTSSLQRPR